MSKSNRLKRLYQSHLHVMFTAVAGLGARLNGRGDEFAGAMAGGVGGAAPKLGAGVGATLRGAEHHGPTATRAVRAGGACTHCA